MSSGGLTFQVSLCGDMEVYGEGVASEAVVAAIRKNPRVRHVNTRNSSDEISITRDVMYPVSGSVWLAQMEYHVLKAYDENR